MRYYVLLFAVLLIFSASYKKCYCQLPAGKIGIGTTLAASSPGINLAYAFSESFELSLGLNYLSSTNETDGNSVDASNFSLGIGTRIFLMDNSLVDPYIGLGISYADSPGSFAFESGDGVDIEATSFGVNLGIGAQAEISKSLIVFASTGINYGQADAEIGSGNSKIEQTQSQISLLTSSVGVIFYFR